MILRVLVVQKNPLTFSVNAKLTGKVSYFSDQISYLELTLPYYFYTFFKLITMGSKSYSRSIIVQPDMSKIFCLIWLSFSVAKLRRILGVGSYHLEFVFCDMRYFFEINTFSYQHGTSLRESRIKQKCSSKNYFTPLSMLILFLGKVEHRF